MAATGNEFVLLKQLKLATGYIGSLISALKTEISTLQTSKLDAPSSAGTDGQMLVYGSAGNQWIDVPEGTAYSADNATLQLTGTQFSVKDGGITADKIADGTITEDKIAENILPTFGTGATGGGVTPHSDYVYLSIPVSNDERREIYHNVTLTIQAATSTDSGIMSAADKAKLDSLPSSFTDPAVDIVRTTTHSTSYTKDTLEIVTDTSGKVTEMWFVTAD